jgi:hypothetical protein
MQQLDGKPVVMKLVEDGVQRLVPPVVIQHEPLAAVEAEPTTFSQEAPTSPDDSQSPADSPIAPQGKQEKE